MTKKLYLPLLVALVAVLTSCSSKMGELSSDYFTVILQFRLLYRCAMYFTFQHIDCHTCISSFI